LAHSTVPYATPVLRRKTFNHQNNSQRILENVNVSRQFASIGYAVFVRKATLVNFCMNTISDECQSVGGSLSTGIVRLETKCLYAHPKERRIECPDYNRGFCKLGPSCPRKHVRRVVCQLYLTGFCPMGPECPKGHPKPNMPPPAAYEPASTPSPRDLGPPPPGYGRYADFDRGANPGGPQAGGPQGPRRNLDEVLCFKCGEKGHYANHCTNRNKPGNRGGVERITRKFDD